MKKNILPTGYLFTDEYDRGQLETLSIGDYGKASNIKADFLGYTQPLNGVPNGQCKPLSEKWVITLSTQYGCPMKCNFCFPAGTQVSTDHGQVNIENITKNDEVISFHDQGFCENIVTDTFERDYDGELVCVEFENGTLLEMTPEHPVLVKLNDQMVWMMAKNLQEFHEVVQYNL